MFAHLDPVTLDYWMTLAVSGAILLAFLFAVLALPWSDEELRAMAPMPAPTPRPQPRPHLPAPRPAPRPAWNRSVPRRLVLRFVRRHGEWLRDHVEVRGA